MLSDLTVLYYIILYAAIIVSIKLIMNCCSICFCIISHTGSSKSLRNRRLFTANATSLPSTSSHSSIDSSHLSEDSSTSVHISNKQLAGSSSSVHIPTMTVSSSADGDMDTGVHLSIPDNQWTEISSLTGLQAPQGNSNTESGGTRHATTTLTLPDEQWDWSPFKQLSSHR